MGKPASFPTIEGNVSGRLSYRQSISQLRLSDNALTYFLSTF